METKGKLLPILSPICGPSGFHYDSKENKQSLSDLINSCWSAATSPDPKDKHKLPFRCDAMISNPTTFGHIHVAQALGVAPNLNI